MVSTENVEKKIDRVELFRGLYTVHISVEPPGPHPEFWIARANSTKAPVRMASLGEGRMELYVVRTNREDVLEAIVDLAGNGWTVPTGLHVPRTPEEPEQEGNA
jgi:hypothetical protein